MERHGHNAMSHVVAALVLLTVGAARAQLQPADAPPALNDT
ncbi:unnamed protein product, partial [Colias eurytheme]